VVEIRSPSTALFDLNAKRAAYQQFGVESYWIVVPDLAEPELVAFQPRGARYVQTAHVRGEESSAAQWPFPVEIVFARLVAGLR
jgi:Uma2 family endonuclease